MEIPGHEANDEVKELEEATGKVTSPMVGTFFRAPSPDADVFVEEGETWTLDRPWPSLRP